MKLSRKWARTAIVFLCLGLLFMIAAIAARQYWCVAAFFFFSFTALLIRMIRLRCPHCGRSVAPLRWRYSIDTKYCPHCGKAFQYDDE